MKRAKAGCETSPGSMALDQIRDNHDLGKGGDCGDRKKRTALEHISETSITGLKNGWDMTEGKEGMSQR